MLAFAFVDLKADSARGNGVELQPWGSVFGMHFRKQPFRKHLWEVTLDKAKHYNVTG